MAKIFVVEDSIAQASQMAHYLGKAGHEVLIYANGQLALDAMGEPPDLILSDIGMPVMDGLQLCTALKDNSAYSRIPVVLVTVSDQIEALVNGLNVMSDGYLIKPCDPNILLETVDTLLSRKLGGALPESYADSATSITFGDKTYTLLTGRERIFEFFMIAFRNSAVQARELEAREKKLKEVNRALSRNIDLLSASEDQFRSLVETVPDIVYKINAEGRITFINESIRQLGWEVSEVVGKHFSELLYYEDVDGVSADKVLPDLVDEQPGSPPKLFDERRTRDRMTVGLRVRMKSKNQGTKRGEICAIGYELLSVEVNSMGMYGDKGKAGRMYIGSVGAIRDISSRIEIESELQASKDLADRANRAKSEFLSAMSHELRTPLNSIMGFGQLLDNDDNPLNTEQKEMFDCMMDSSEHLLKLINDVLDLSKIEVGAHAVEIKSVDPAPHCVSSLKMVENAASNRQIRIVNEIDNELPRLRVDEVRFRQILINLLFNAVKYNRLQGTVAIASESRGTKLRILVKDTGIGIATDKLGELFQPFNRLDMANSGIEGTGIGLHISKRLVEAMGGEIGVISQLGEGSTFWVDFVIDTDAPRDAPAEAVTPDLPDESLTLLSREMKVLYVEDNEANVFLMKSILQRMPGVSVHVATTAEEGIQHALAHQPNLILMDVRLPGIDGIEAAQILKSQPETAHIPIVAVTADAMIHDMERAKSAGFSAYLTKPFKISDVQRLVDQQTH